jgi:hypothetical protein
MDGAPSVALLSYEVLESHEVPSRRLFSVQSASVCFGSKAANGFIESLYAMRAVNSFMAGHFAKLAWHRAGGPHQLSCAGTYPTGGAQQGGLRPIDARPSDFTVASAGVSNAGAVAGFDKANR